MTITIDILDQQINEQSAVIRSNSALANTLENNLNQARQNIIKATGAMEMAMQLRHSILTVNDSTSVPVPVVPPEFDIPPEDARANSVPVPMKAPRVKKVK